MRRRTERHRLRFLGPMLSVVLLCVAAGTAGGLIARSTSTDSTTKTSTLPGTACAATSVAKTDLPAVVTVMVSNGSSGSVGSGEVIGSSGYILTNNHVIAPAANGGSVEVRFDDGTTAPARIAGRDPLTDLAVIKVDVDRALPTIPLGDSSNVQVGEPVLVLGSPLGLSSTVTSGIVSALDRTVTVPGEGSRSAFLFDAVQTDAPINPGNSGGALVNCSGRLIGVPSAGATVPTSSGEASSGSIGLGFAIPVDLARVISAELIATGKATHAYLGLDAEPLASGTGVPSPGPSGLLVTGVAAGGPAAVAGLRPGDVITAIDGRPANTTDQLVVLTLTRPAGARVSLGYQRAGRSASTSIVLGVEP